MQDTATNKRKMQSPSSKENSMPDIQKRRRRLGGKECSIECRPVGKALVQAQESPEDVDMDMDMETEPVGRSWISEKYSILYKERQCMETSDMARRVLFFCAVIDFLKNKTGLFERTKYMLRGSSARDVVQQMLDEGDEFAIELCRAIDRGQVEEYFRRNPDSLDIMKSAGYTHDAIECLTTSYNSVLYHHAFSSIGDDMLRDDKGVGVKR